MKIIEVVSNTITRPSDTTAYASGDLMANSTTAGSVTPFTLSVPYGRGLKVWRVAVDRSSSTVANATFRVHLYNDTPTVTNGDNGAWLSIKAGYQGFVDVAGSSQAFSDASTAYGIYVNNSLAAPMLIAADVDYKVYALLEARAAYTPASAETITIRLLGEAYA